MLVKRRWKKAKYIIIVKFCEKEKQLTEVLSFFKGMPEISLFTIEESCLSEFLYLFQVPLGGSVGQKFYTRKRRPM